MSLSELKAKRTSDWQLSILQAPSPAALRQLRGQWLEAGMAADTPVWRVLDQFYHFLNQLAAKASSWEYSHFASMLDMGAVGGVALQNLLSPEKAGQLWQRLLIAGVSEGLMVMAARQYVKAWEGEMAAVYAAAAWDLYGELWRASTEMMPELPGAERRRLMDALLEPVHDEEVGGVVKAALIARLYQLLLLAYLGEFVV